MDRERVPTRMTLRTARALAAAFMLAAIAGCDGPGIFYTLATESPRSNRNLPDELTVTAVVSAGSHFYVAAGGMWRRAHAGDTWQPVTRPVRAGSGELLVLGLAAAGDTLCAGTARGVYRAPAGEAPGWRPVSGVPDSEQVLRVFAIPRAVETEPETEILAVTQPREDEPVYRLYRSDDRCLTFVPVAALRDVSGLPYDATFAFDAYWVTVGERLYRGDTLDELKAAAAQPDGAGRLRGVLLAGDRLYVADESGGIHRSEDPGGSWNSVRIEPPVDDAEAVPLTLFTTGCRHHPDRNQGFRFLPVRGWRPRAGGTWAAHHQPALRGPPHGIRAVRLPGRRAPQKSRIRRHRRRRTLQPRRRRSERQLRHLELGVTGPVATRQRGERACSDSTVRR